MTSKIERVSTKDGEIVVADQKPQIIRVFMNGNELLGHCCTDEAMAQEYISMAPGMLTYTIEEATS